MITKGAAVKFVIFVVTNNDYMCKFWIVPKGISNLWIGNINCSASILRAHYWGLSKRKRRQINFTVAIWEKNFVNVRKADRRYAEVCHTFFGDGIEGKGNRTLIAQTKIDCIGLCSTPGDREINQSNTSWVEIAAGLRWWVQPSSDWSMFSVIKSDCRHFCINRVHRNRIQCHVRKHIEVFALLIVAEHDQCFITKCWVIL